MSRRVCLAIGVSDVTAVTGQTSPFAYLDGAFVAAEGLGQWAINTGFGSENVCIVTDRRNGAGALQPVTEVRVQAAIESLFPEGAEPVSHFLLHFCGHGLTDSTIGSTFWLFSDALQKRYKVAVDGFIDELLRFGVERISLISDACRDGPADLDLSRLEARRGIFGWGGKVDSPMFDRLTACQDGAKAYMVLDPNMAAEPGKCILSGVALDVLWGEEPDAFRGDIIDTASFGGVARRRASERAQNYKLKLHPFCIVDPVAAPLVDRSNPIGQPVPGLKPWPPIAGVAPMGGGAFNLPSDGMLGFETLKADVILRKEILGRNFGTSHPDLDGGSDFSLPESSRELIDELIEARRREATPDVPGPAGETSRSLVRAIEGTVAEQSREATADRVGSLLRRMDVQFFQFMDADLVVSGGEVRWIWSNSPVSLVSRGDSYIAFRTLRWPDSGTQVLVEFDDGLFAPVYTYGGLVAAVVRDANGIAGICYGKEPYDFDRAIQLVTDLAAARIDATQVDRLAAEVREAKHANPILGVIAAYLYRTVADFENITRMAYYYVSHGQPIPFDIVLLGDLKMVPSGRHRTNVIVPPVRGRLSRDGSLPDYIQGETPSVIGVIGGSCPWFTMGWDYPPRRDAHRQNEMSETKTIGMHELFKRRGLFSLQRRPLDPISAEDRGFGLVRPSTFTVINARAARRVAKRWGLRPTNVRQ